MQIYLVGGAVRDKLLDIPVRERDWVVVGAAESELLELGYRRVGKDFPVFLHPGTGDEYALARRETKTAPGYKGFSVDASRNVSLEEDLQRRDLTINAMAEDRDGNLVDPYGGRADLERRLLRHVSPAFSEDPLRVLRVARFAARFAHLGFRIAPETLSLMRSIVLAGELQHLVAERIWKECETALREGAPAVYFRVLRDCGALAVILPEVDSLFGVPQPEKHHPEIDTGVHTMMSLEQAAGLTDDPVVRFATLVHDVGKGATPRDNWPHHYAHESLGLTLVDRICTRLRVPNEYRELARLACEHHTKMHRIKELRSATLLDLLDNLDAFRRPARIGQFLLACQADAQGRTGLENRPYPQADILQAAHQAACAVDVKALLEGRDLKPGAIRSLLRGKRIEAITNALQRSS